MAAYNPLPPPEELLAFIREGSKFLIAGHKEPDGDCVGSQLVLAAVLRRLGKEAILCSAGPFRRTEVIPYKDLFRAELSPADISGSRLIVVDCGSLDRTGDLAKFLEKTGPAEASIAGHLPSAVIDHHATGLPFADVCYIDHEASATCVMVLSLLEAMGIEPHAEEAELLFFGLCTDTGFFRHLDTRGAGIFAAAASLVRAGANPKKVFNAINGGKTLASRLLLGAVLSRAEPYFDGRLIVSIETAEETQKYGKESRDSDMVYQLLQSIEGVEAMVVIRQESEGKCTVGFRSRDAVDVSKIAVELGGGGHKNAAGLAIDGVIAEIKPKILKLFEKIFVP